MLTVKTSIVFALLVSQCWEVLEDGERCESWHGSLFTCADSSSFSVAVVIPAAGCTDVPTVYHAKWFLYDIKGWVKGRREPTFYFSFFKYIKKVWVHRYFSCNGYLIH